MRISDEIAREMIANGWTSEGLRSNRSAIMCAHGWDDELMDMIIEDMEGLE